MLYSRIDLHKHSLVIHTVGEDGTAVREAELATARPALTKYRKAISYAKVKTDRVDARRLAQLLRVGSSRRPI